MITDLSDSDPRRVGPYRLLGRIGAGGMGVVYLASSPLEDVVAVKLIRADLAQDVSFRARFAREVDAARRVGGVCTARVRDADLEGDRPWVATDFVAGPNLADLVDRHGPLPADQQRALAVGLAEALSAVHGAGVVHRDLKPSNVLCSPSGPRLIDFGIARATDSTSATLTGQFVGSPSWMAPEQIRGQAATPAVDMFALGSVLVFAATGQPPFGTGQMEAVMYRILNEAPDLGPPGALTSELVPLVSALLARESASRPTPDRILTDLAGDTAEPAQAVTAILERTWVLPPDEAVRVPATVGVPVADPTPRKRRPGKAIASATAAAAVVILVAALILAKPGNGHKLQANSTSTTPTARSASAAKSDPTQTPATTTPPTTPRTTPPTLPTTSTVTTPPTTTVPTTAPPTTPSALTVVQEYFAAINARDFQRAWNLGGKNWTPSYAAFVEGFSTTLSSTLTKTSVEGSKVYVTIVATQDSGDQFIYSGSYIVSNGVLTSADVTRIAVDKPLATASTTTVPVMPAAPPCGDTGPVIQPTSIYFGCATGADELFPISWTVWTSTSAGGVATASINNCTPDCASGTSTSFPVNVQLSDPGYVNGAYVFQTITTIPLGSGGQSQSSSDPESGWGAG